MMTPYEDIPDQFPLSETTFLILLSLAPAPNHGYAIAKDVQAMSAGRVVLSVSTLYTTLKRLLEDGWIERYGEEPGPDATGRLQAARLYLLAAAGFILGVVVREATGFLLVMLANLADPAGGAYQGIGLQVVYPLVSGIIEGALRGWFLGWALGQQKVGEMQRGMAQVPG